MLNNTKISGSISVSLPITGRINVGKKTVKELKFLEFSEFPETGNEFTLYICTTNDKTYRWDGTMYRTLSLPDYEILAHTTAEWQDLSNYQSKFGSIYIYTDYDVKDGVNIPAIKIGDGSAYVVDLPFMSCGVTEEEKDFWNNKVSAVIDPYDSENLVLYTGNTIIIGGNQNG